MRVTTSRWRFALEYMDMRIVGRAAAHAPTLNTLPASLVPGRCQKIRYWSDHGYPR
jgi:hypothetical protein